MPLRRVRGCGPLLLEPDAYVPATLDICHDAELRGYWLDLFRHHIRSAVAHVAREHPEDAMLQRRMQRAATGFTAHVDGLAADPHAAPFDGLTLCAERERLLRAAGVDDPFRRAKERENETALALLPQLLAEVDALPVAARLDALVEGIFAGNVFDLGSHATARLFDEGGTEFRGVRARLRPRPWLVDDLDAFRERFVRRFGCALLFVDNAGSDVVLGMLPFARELLQRGTRVILSANRTPTLNDVTQGELDKLVEGVTAWDSVFADARDSGQLLLVTSGNGIPLIDLRRLGPELRAALRQHPPDLVVLEGMGRAVESNWNARLRCDVLKLAMLKDASVARFLGGELYDLVLRFETRR